MRPLPSRNTDGNGVPVFGARSPARSESGDTGSGTRPRFSDGAASVAGASGDGLRAPSDRGRAGSLGGVAGVFVATVLAGAALLPANKAGVPPAAARAPSRPSGANAARLRRSPRDSPSGQSHVPGATVVGGVVVCARRTAGAAHSAAHTTAVIVCLIIAGTPVLRARDVTLQTERTAHATELRAIVLRRTSSRDQPTASGADS